VSIMYDVLDVSRKGYYAWLKRPLCARAQRRSQLLERIKEVHEHSRGSYGSPRVTVELNEEEIAVSENTVAKYMREGGMGVKPRRRFVPQTTDSDHDCPIAPNLLDQDFSACAPDRKWACDLTYIWTMKGGFTSRW
jgi:putative transposase